MWHGSEVQTEALAQALQEDGYFMIHLDLVSKATIVHHGVIQLVSAVRTSTSTVSDHLSPGPGHHR
jgi:hypothetical protein